MLGSVALCSGSKGPLLLVGDQCIRSSLERSVVILRYYDLKGKQ